MTAPAITAAHTQAPANPLVEFTLFKGAGATPSIKVKNGTLKSGGTWTALCEALTTVKPTEFNPDAINANTRTIAANVAVLTANVDKVEWCNSITATHDNTIEYAAQVAAYNEQVKAYNQSIKSDKSKAKLEPLLTLKLMQHLLKLGTFNNNSRADGNKLATISGLELDYDSGTMPMKEAAYLLQAAGVASFLYPSFSATQYVHKWRALIPFSKSLPAEQRIEWLAVLGDVLGLEANSETKVDKQIFFFGRNPAQDYSTIKVEGACLDTIPGMITARVTHQAQTAVEAAIKREKQRAQTVGATLKPGQVSPIEGFNETFSVEELLFEAGYTKHGNRFKHPASTTEAGLNILKCKDGKQRTWSHNGNDPLHGAAHDAFDCFCILQHGGDFNAALKAAGAMVCTTSGATVTEHNQQVYRESKRDEWGDPEPLTEQTTAKPYPIDALPGIIGEAVKEVAGIVKCPIALTASSALSVLATVGQGCADVQPHAGLKPSPLSLYMLVVGDSGERKSTNDAFFSDVLSRWSKHKADGLEEQTKRYSAEMKSINNQRLGLERAIAKAAEKGTPVQELNERLAELEISEPKQVFIPKLKIEDATSEAMGYNLKTRWPSAGLLTSEAGIFFGGHGMKAENTMRNFAFINSRWGNEEYTQDRRGSDNYVLSNARLSIGLGVQMSILVAFNETNGDKARGSGFFARFLCSSPETTMGGRFITPEETKHKEPTPNLDLFQARLTDLLELHYHNGKNGSFENMPVLRLSDQARDTWVNYFNSVERNIANGGDFDSLRDVASKSADNAARLAGLFHLLAVDIPDIQDDVFDETTIAYGEISGETMRAACKLAKWHLYEVRRIFDELVLPVADMAAVKLDEWLIAECKARGQTAVSRSYALQRAPGSLRKASKLNAALDTLTRANRARHGKEGSAAIIEVNPALLG